MQEAKELAKETAYEFEAHPLEDNIFEWHFTVRGPKDTDFEDGRYHGRILLPNEYPFKPPEIIFLTPNGRFELNTKICLSITGFHPEFWQPAWGIRTVLLAVIGFFPTEAKGALGGLDYTKEERKRLAKKSIGWACSVCGVNTKDALSDTQPEISPEALREELPNFMITYRPEKEEKKQESEPIVNKAEGSSSQGAIPDATTEKEKAVEKNVNDSPSDVNVARQPVKKNIGNSVQNAECTGTADMVRIEQFNSSVSNTSSNGNSLEQARSPMWLDALIVGLISLLIGLLVQKFAY